MRLSLLIALLGCGSRRDTPPPAEPAPAGPVVVDGVGLPGDLEATLAFLAGRPEYETPLGAGLEPPEALGAQSAAACGACHAEIYAEWQVSTHAAAWTDRQFQAEIGKSGNRWLCLNCHTPLLVQHDRWPVGLQSGDVELPLLVENPVFDEALRDEGITCAACHVVDGVVHGPGLPDSTAPHAVVADERFTTDALCLRCHQATATYEGKPFVCTFDTGTEWASGPYAARDIGCSDCHMPAISRPAATGGPVREVRRHWWRGAGIAKVEGGGPPLEANPPGLDLTATWTGAALSVVATNARAGHRLPTGDPERFIRIDATFTGADGAPVGDPWSARIGQTWEWHPVARKLGDDRLAPEESRTYTVPVPEGAAGAVIEASSHRMTAETAAYHHLDGYPTSLVTHRIALTPGSP